MSGLLDKAKNTASGKLNQDAQPGDQVERSADSGVNNEVNQVAGDVGVPQQDDQTLDKAADAKANSDIPFGNN
ncbi:hypothetical protein EG329_011552 [Mollisiaceae sp. DMI_Dod_QoI]|nr:hypothetical protein EG329_011552 [Helotiales sp. DMI_Dod_QoI]